MARASGALAAGVLAAAALLAPLPAVALCAKPILPHCASDGDFVDPYVSEDACRREVAAHLGELHVYRGCLSEALEVIDREAERLERLLSDGAAEAVSEGPAG